MAGPPRVTRDEFDHWVFDMDEALERFHDALPAEVSGSLDGSPESLDALERWILQNYDDAREMLASDQAAIVDGAGRYIGEVFRRHLNRYWDIELADPRDAFFNLPVLVGGFTPIAPTALATATANRRTGSYLRSLFEANRKADSRRAG